MKQILQNVLLLLALFTVMSCKKATQEPEATLNQKDISLHYNESFTFEVKKGNNVIDFSTLTTSSSDEFVGTINNQGVFEANTIGETTIKIMGDGVNLTAKVTVTPIQNLFEEPVINFSFNKSQIKAAEKRLLRQEVATALAYVGENSNVEEVVYLFNTQGKLSGAGLMFPTSSVLVEKVAVYFAERYDPIGTLDDYYIFQKPNVDYAVGVGYTVDLGFHALYFNTSESSALDLHQRITPLATRPEKGNVDTFKEKFGAFGKWFENERVDY